MRKARAALGSTGIFANPAPAPVQTTPKATTAQGTTSARPDREGRKPLPFWTTEAAKRQLRIMAAEMDTTQQNLMTDALNMLFQHHGKPPIA
jgi:hypothetical protein